MHAERGQPAERTKFRASQEFNKLTIRTLPAIAPSHTAGRLDFSEYFVAQSFALMIARMSRPANSESEAGSAAIAIAMIVGLLYLYLGSAPHQGHGPTAPTGIPQQSK